MRTGTPSSQKVVPGPVGVPRRCRRRRSSACTKGYGSSWIFGPFLTCSNALRRVHYPAFCLGKCRSRSPPRSSAALRKRRGSCNEGAIGGLTVRWFRSDRPPGDWCPAHMATLASGPCRCLRPSAAWTGVRPPCPEPGRHSGRPQRKHPAVFAAGPLMSPHEPSVTVPAGRRPCSLRRPVACGSSSPGTVRLRAPRVAVSAAAAAWTTRVHAGGRRGRHAIGAR
jgi:hypothetical protein